MKEAILLLGIVAYYTIGRRCQSMILIVISLYVYWLVANWSIIPIVILSLIITLCGYFIEKYRSKWFLILPIILIILTFTLFRHSVLGLTLPIGLSVLSFTGISYLVDQYRNPRRDSIWDVLSYLLFFPKIFAGPIERANDFINDEPHRFSSINIYNGIKYLIFASFCKFVVGDMLSSTEFNSHGIGLLFQMLTFGIGFFFDFWAYTMMAIGVGCLFGYRLSISFNKPYYAGTFAEFWHRWNITLGTWLRDYVYIPCGGNRLSLPVWSLAVLFVFIVSGLWHGTTIPFIVWGLINGSLIIVERIIIKTKRLKGIHGNIYALTVAVVMALLWQLFIVDSLRELQYRFQDVFIVSSFDIMPLIQFLVCLLSMIVLTSDKVFNLVRYESTTPGKIIAEGTMLSLMFVTLVFLNCPMSFNFFYFRF